MTGCRRHCVKPTETRFGEEGRNATVGRRLNVEIGRMEKSEQDVSKNVEKEGTGIKVCRRLEWQLASTKAINSNRPHRVVRG